MENYETSLKGISALLKSKLNTLEDLDSQTIASCEDENMDKETIEATDYEMNVHLCSAEIEDALEKLRPSQHGSDNWSLRTSASNRNIRLPKININPFDGNPMNYQSFADSFESAVNANEQLTKVEKFLYLKGFLKGKALSTIEGLSLTSSNYDEAMSLLRWLPSKNQPKIKFYKIVWNQSFLDQNLTQILSQEKHTKQEVFDLIFYEVVTYFSDFLV